MMDPNGWIEPKFMVTNLRGTMRVKLRSGTYQVHCQAWYARLLTRKHELRALWEGHYRLVWL